MKIGMKINTPPYANITLESSDLESWDLCVGELKSLLGSNPKLDSCLNAVQREILDL